MTAITIRPYVEKKDHVGRYHGKNNPIFTNGTRYRVQFLRWWGVKDNKLVLIGTPGADPYIFLNVRTNKGSKNRHVLANTEGYIDLTRDSILLNSLAPDDGRRLATYAPIAKWHNQINSPTLWIITPKSGRHRLTVKFRSIVQRIMDESLKGELSVYSRN